MVLYVMGDNFDDIDDNYDEDNAGLGPQEDGLVLGDKRGQWGLWRRVGQKGY